MRDAAPIVSLTVDPVDASSRKVSSATPSSRCVCSKRSTVPWDDAGAYIRFSATFESKGLADEKRVLNEFKKRMRGLQFEF